MSLILSQKQRGTWMSYMKNEEFEWCRGVCLTARKGERCNNFPSPGSRYCWRHKSQGTTLVLMLERYRYDNNYSCTCCGHHRNHGCKDDCEVNNVIKAEANRVRTEAEGV